MKNKKESLILGRMLKKIAPQIGATVFLEPKWGIVGQITFKSGKHSYFRYNTLDLNPVGSSDIAKDKDYAAFFMSNMGYPTVPGSRAFFTDEWAKIVRASRQGIDGAYRHAIKIGFPVIVKPNSGSQGSGVSLVRNKKEFYRSVRTIFKKDKVVLVQKPVNGKDYRIVVLDNDIISAYQRIPLNVIGDGKSTIRRLLENKQKEFIASKRDTQIRMDDLRIATKLHHQRLSLKSIAGKDQKIYLLDNANLSTGGDSIDVTNQIHPEFKKIAVNLTRDMGLRLCGVDIMVNGSLNDKPDKYWILEINAAPGLDHYSKIGKEQEMIVEDLYLRVLEHLEG